MWIREREGQQKRTIQAGERGIRMITRDGELLGRMRVKVPAIDGGVRVDGRAYPIQAIELAAGDKYNRMNNTKMIGRWLRWNTRETRQKSRITRRSKRSLSVRSSEF